MLLAILLGLQIIGNFLVGVESIDKLGKGNDSDNEVDKRDENGISESQLNLLLILYDRARVATFTHENVIPDPRCHWPFDIHRNDESRTLQYRNQYCKNDVGSTDIWCSTDITKSYTRGSGKWEHCLMKGAEVADPKKWKPHKDCVPLFTYNNPKYKKEMYYKGCKLSTNIDKEKPWCSHKYRYESKKWSYCINIKKINGGWSKWSPLNNCSVTCGSGMQTKTRECNNPEPQFGGKDCDKDDVKKEPCKLAECPNDQVEDDNQKLSKMSNKSGLSKIVFAIFGSIGGLILIAVVIAVVMYGNKKMRKSSVASSTTGQAGIVYQESARD